MITPQTIVGGRYRVVKVLGGGGMKLVYLAEDLRLAGRRCALAEMVDSFSSADNQKQAIGAFQREADMLAQLSNEHIPRVFDRFSEANHHFLVMEYIDGTTLEDKLKQHGGKLGPEQVVEIALQVLDTLDYLHHLVPAVIYRDLKPSNIMVTAEGQAKLIDFGIARHFQPLSNATMIGTQGYAPPEQYRGKVETCSDIYALGATMHHAISGRDPALEPPFSFPPLQKLLPQIDVRLAAAIDQALAYDVANRIPDAAEFKRRLLEVKAIPSAAVSAGGTGQGTAVPAPHYGGKQLKLRLRAGSVLSASIPSVGTGGLPPQSPLPSHSTGSATVLAAASEITCPQCARPIPADSRFCSYCASDLRVLGPLREQSAPEAETVLLSGSPPPQAFRSSTLESYPPVKPPFIRWRYGLRRPFLVLALIFAAGFILAKLLFGHQSDDTVPPAYSTGSDDIPGMTSRVHAASADHSSPGAVTGSEEDALGGPLSSIDRETLRELRSRLDGQGYARVKFRADGDVLVLYGTVPTASDRAAVQLICFVTVRTRDGRPIFSLSDNLRVAGEEPDG